MILRTTDERHAKDEASFRKYLVEILGEADEKRLIEFTWDHSATPVAYMLSLAHLVRGVRTEGRKHVERILEVAAKPKHVREASMDLAVFAKVVVDDVAGRVRDAKPEDRAKVAQEGWDEVLTRVRVQLVKMFPEAQPDHIEMALREGCAWDRQKGSFGVVANKMIAVLLP